MVKIKSLKFDGIYLIDDKLATINLVPGQRVYGEQLIKIKGVEYREWIPFRSKPAAAIKKNLKTFPLKKGMKVLYLGCGSGTTCSHYSDIVGKDGLIYAIDIAEKPMRDMIKVAEARGNIITILGDCRKPEEYENLILEKVDCVYCDIADPQEVEVFIRNCKKFLKKDGYGMIAIKSRSIDVIKEPQVIYIEARKKLEENGFNILDFVTLDPYEKDHAFIVVNMR